jgi:membrane protein implicated in regulation of membrane protease activity
MMDWWNTLAMDLQIFYGVGILATLLLVIQLIMTMLGLGDDGAADGMDAGFGDGADGIMDGGGEAMDGGDSEHGDGLSLISTRTIVAFLAGFGWTGAMARGGDLGLPLAVVAAVAVGFVLMLMVFWLMRALYSLRQSGSLDYHNAIGEMGTVYVKIPPRGEGSGQIQIVVQGRLATVAAITDSVEPILSGKQVKVIKLQAGNTLQVETI